MGDKLSKEELDAYRRMAEMPVANSGAIAVLLRHIAALEKERDAALADNAALLQALEDVAELRLSGQTLKALAVKLRGEPHSGDALLDEHKRALVRARNEGLEKAKAAVMRTTQENRRPSFMDMCRAIDSLKELESDPSDKVET